MKIVSLNVRGISNLKKRRTIFTWCRRKNADVIFLQETHSFLASEKQWKNEWGGKMLFSYGSPNSCGTATLISNKANLTKLNEIKEKLELLYEEKTNGIIVRARARWHEHGERGTTEYFLNLEKRNHVKKHIRNFSISGVITTDPYRILSEQKKFYQNLYQTKATDSDCVKSFPNDLNIPQLSEEQKQSCEGGITAEECSDILETFQNNKSPGNDGIPIEFYKKCWNLICKPFINCDSRLCVKALLL